jgi:hypothetical protein
MKDNKYVKEEVLPELGNEKLGDAVAKKLEFYDGTDWVEINAGTVSGKANEITVTPNQSSQGRVVSIATNPIIPGDTVIDSTGFLKLPVGTTLQRPVVPQVGMVRFNIASYTNVTVAPAFSVALSPIGTGSSNTVIDYNKFNRNVWTSEIADNPPIYEATLRPFNGVGYEMSQISSLLVSELNFLAYGITLRWPTQITFAVNDYFLLTFS